MTLKTVQDEDGYNFSLHCGISLRNNNTFGNHGRAPRGSVFILLSSICRCATPVPYNGAIVVNLSRLRQADRSDSDQSRPTPRIVDLSPCCGRVPLRFLVVPTTPSAVSAMHSSRPSSLLARSVGEAPLEFQHGAGDLVAHAGLATRSGGGGCCRWCATSADTAFGCPCWSDGSGSGCSCFGAEKALLECGLCAYGTSAAGSSYFGCWVFHGCCGGGNGGFTCMTFGSAESHIGSCFV